MIFSVVTTPEFDTRLEEAVKHRIELHGLRSARMLLDDFEASSERLAMTPRMGAKIESTEKRAEKDALRWIRIASYIATYRIHSDKKQVVLLGLFYATSNWKRRIL